MALAMAPLFRQVRCARDTQATAAHEGQAMNSVWKTWDFHGIYECLRVLNGIFMGKHDKMTIFHGS